MSAGKKKGISMRLSLKSGNMTTFQTDSSDSLHIGTAIFGTQKKKMLNCEPVIC